MLNMEGSTARLVAGCLCAAKAATSSEQASVSNAAAVQILIDMLRETGARDNENAQKPH